jgi:asparagine synthase (glutamine-hydrolysing)
LLSAQGDRVSLAHGVEGRFPFLDHRLFEFAAALPVRSKLCGLREKEILRRWAGTVVPPPVRERPKQPYRAPDVPAFFGPHEPEYVTELLDASAIRRTGYFDPAAVQALVARCRAGRASAARESQALVGILSTQLWHDEFFNRVRVADHELRTDVAIHESDQDTQTQLSFAEAR